MNLELVELAERIKDLSKEEKKEFYLYFYDNLIEAYNLMDERQKDEYLDCIDVEVRTNEDDDNEYAVRDLEYQIEKLEKQIKLLETK